MERREFLKWQFYSLLFLFMGPRVSWGSQGASEGARVIAIKGEAQKALEMGMKELGGMERFLKTNSRVVIKPNMSFRNPPEMATTTNPELVKALVDMISRYRPKVIKVLDNTLADPDACMENSGIRRALTGTPCELKIVKAKKDYQEVRVQGKTVNQMEIIKDVLEADLLISVPVAKHHSSAGVSLSMKNLMGLIYDRSSFHYKYDLHAAIVDLASYLRPRLVVIDMTRALKTNGPSGPGDVEKMDTVVVSNDMVAADAYVTSRVKWYGRQVDPFKVKHIAIASETGVGVGDLRKVDIIEKTA